MTTEDWIGLVIAGLVIAIVLIGFGISIGEFLERDAWRTSKRYLDRSGCVWLRDGENWKPDECRYSTVPVPQKPAEAPAK